MAVKDKNTLKTYFETGDIPSQNQFEDLIDSLKHQNDTFANLSKEELMLMNNSFANIENGYVMYNMYDINNQTVILDVTQQNRPNQIIELRSTAGDQLKQYFLGDAPYTIHLKEFKSENLAPTEYYFFYWSVSQEDPMQKLLGNNLPDTSTDFELGTVELGKRLYLQISKQNIGQQVNIVPTHIKWINTTGVPIAYKAESGYWGNPYRTTDTVTDHYDLWDYLSFQFNADMTNETQTIVCSLYDNDNGQLVQTTYLTPGQNYKSIWGGQVNGVRNVLIECTKE